MHLYLQNLARFGCRVAAAAAVVVLASPQTAAAMRVSPMVAEISVTGAGSSARIEVGNDEKAPLPFETHISRLEIDRDGNLSQTPADEDFLVFPPQGLIAAGGSQTIRVQWLGDPHLASSRSYFLEVRQLPVALQPDASADRTSVHVMINYRIEALITVAPAGAKSKVSIVSIDPEMITPPRPPQLHVDPSAAPPPDAPAPQPEPGLRVVLKNVGSRHALMGGVNWIFDAKGADGQPVHVVIPAGTITNDIGIGYLPPDGERVFNVPFDRAVSGPVSLRFTE
jgi:fimbrial chaperone protein